MIDPSKFIHSEDASALQKLKKIPGFTIIAKKYLEYGYEKIFFGENVGSNIRLSPTQLPHIYKYLPPICDKLEMEEPEFYLQMNPSPNAYTFGDTYKFICVTSGLIEMMDDEEITAVIAHECGHILCRHSLYHTMAHTLLEDASKSLFSEELSVAIKLALLYWERKGELSCDRVAAAVTSPEIVTRVMARLAGGSKMLLAKMNIQEWIEQADRYDKLYNDEGILNKAIQAYGIMTYHHPYAAVRVREILKWGESQQFLYARSLLKTENNHRCKNCGKAVSKLSTYCLFCGYKH